jgi:hypothetical protein
VRSQVLRLTLSDDAWRFFEAIRDRVQRDDQAIELPPGDRGTRMVLQAWLEEAMEEAASGRR